MGGDGGTSAGDSSEIRKANAKVRITKCDMMGLFLGVAGTSVMLFSGATGQKFREAPSDIDLLWPARDYMMTGPTDIMMHQKYTWKMMKYMSCQAYKMGVDKYGSPEGQAALMAMQMMAGGESPFLECAGKAQCRSSLSTRCMYYDYQWWDYLIFCGFMPLALGCWGAGGVILLLCGKKKYRVFVGLCWIFACFWCNMLLCYYCYDSDDMLNAMGSGTPYPYARLYGVGWFVSLGGSVGAYFGYCAGCCTMLPEPDSDETDDGEEGEEALL